MSDALKHIYFGLSARAYDALLPRGIGDAELYRQAVREGQPALEIASGTGRLLVDFVTEGLDVEGVDYSPDMIAICRHKADERGVEVKVHQQDIRTLDLPRRYRTIYVPIYSFQHLVEMADVEAALRSFRRHLEPRGRLLLSLLLPWKEDFHISPSVQGAWRLRRHGRDAAGRTLRCWEYLVSDEEQVRRTRYRFERIDDGQVLEEEEFVEEMRWYTREGFHDLLSTVGFTEIRDLDLDGSPAAPDAANWVVDARH